MTKTFFAMNNKDAGDKYIDALCLAGYKQIGKLESADFLLIDHEHAGSKRERIAAFLKTRPVFIYPHVPYSYFLWDIYEPLPVACNFVVGEAAIESMRAYGYPYRVEAVGFTACEVKPFEPTQGKKLLFAPAHPLGNGKYPSPQAYQVTQNMAEKVASIAPYFEKVTIRYGTNLQASGLQAFENMDVKYEVIDPYSARSPRKDALRSIAEADLVISCATFGYMAVACGKPTLLYGYKYMIPHTAGGASKNYESYRQWFEFPASADNMTLQEIQAICKEENPFIWAWKRINIGESFDADKFVSVVKEYV